jgi:hypothetical protein
MVMWAHNLLDNNEVESHVTKKNNVVERCIVCKIKCK